MKNISIIGPGALGLYYTAYLTHAGFPVTLIDYKPTRIDKLNSSGITVYTDNNTFTVHVSVQEKLEYSDIVFICVKSYSLQSVLEQWKTVLSQVPIVIIVENGLTWMLYAEEYTLPVGGGIAFSGITRMNDTTIKEYGIGPLYIGALEQKYASRFIETAETITASGLSIIACDDIRSIAWKKCMINAVVNPLTVYYNCSNGELLDNGIRQQHIQNLLKEAVTIAKTEGFIFDFDDIYEQTCSVCQNTSSNISSMLQDIRSGHMIERDALIVPLIESAQKHTLDIPYYREIDAFLLKKLKSISMHSQGA